MTTTSKLGMTRLVENQASAEITVNDAFNVLDAFSGGGLEIKDRTLSTPPPSPADGDIYVPAAGAGGAWLGHDGELAIYQGGWIFRAPKGGMQAFDVQAKERIAYSSVESEWHPTQPSWSATEHWTGEYSRTGSKVYSKTVLFGPLPSTTMPQSVPHGVVGIDFQCPVYFEGSMYNAATSSSFPLPIRSDIGLVVDVQIDASDIIVDANFDVSSYEAEFRIRYCKV